MENGYFKKAIENVKRYLMMLNLMIIEMILLKERNMLKKDFEIFKNTILRAKFVLENEKSFEKWIIKFIYGIWLIL